MNSKRSKKYHFVKNQVLQKWSNEFELVSQKMFYCDNLYDTCKIKKKVLFLDMTVRKKRALGAKNSVIFFCKNFLSSYCSTAIL